MYFFLPLFEANLRHTHTHTHTHTDTPGGQQWPRAVCVCVCAPSGTIFALFGGGGGCSKTLDRALFTRFIIDANWSGSTRRKPAAAAAAAAAAGWWCWW